MFCESCRQALSEAALSGEVASPQLQLHLSQCASCRRAFAEEQSLYRAIDRGVSATVNTPVPASLVPLVRAAISDAPAGQRRFGWTATLIPVGASVAALILLLPRWGEFGSHHPALNEGTSSAHRIETPGVSEPQPSAIAAKALSKNVQLSHPPPSNTSVHPSLALAAGAQRPSPAQQNHQEAAMAQVLLLAREQPQLVSALFNGDSAKPIDIRAIEVPELTWAPLASETDTAREPEQ